jgi:hypothetical protein
MDYDGESIFWLKEHQIWLWEEQYQQVERGKEAFVWREWEDEDLIEY